MQKKEMSFLGHVGELRGHLIRSLIAVIIGAIIVWNFLPWIMDNIFFGPTRSDFITFKLINEYSLKWTGATAIELPDEFPIRVQKLYQQFNVAFMISFFGGMVLALPYIVWEIWRFITPGLHPNERKNSAAFINAVWLFFMMGALVGYFLILPFAINFAVLFKISDIIQPLYDLSDYSALFFQIVLGMGIVFLFPLIIYFLTSIGIVTPTFLKTYRRHAIVVIMVLAAIITPADIVSMMIAAVPLLLLYEFSILLSKRTYKIVQKRALEELQKSR